MRLREILTNEDSSDYIATTYSNLGKALIELNKHDEGLEFLEKSINMRIDIHGENDP